MTEPNVLLDLSRLEHVKTGSLNREAVRALMESVAPGTAVCEDMVIVVAGVAKVFVGQVVEACVDQDLVFVIIIIARRKFDALVGRRKHVQRNQIGQQVIIDVGYVRTH